MNTAKNEVFTGLQCENCFLVGVFTFDGVKSTGGNCFRWGRVGWWGKQIFG